MMSLIDALSDTLNMLRAAHMQCGIHHDGNKRVIKAREALAKARASAGQVERQAEQLTKLRAALQFAIDGYPRTDINHEDYRVKVYMAALDATSTPPSRDQA